MANNLELAGLCYIEEGKAFLKLNKVWVFNISYQRFFDMAFTIEGWKVDVFFTFRVLIGSP